MPFHGSDDDKREIRELIETYGDAVIQRDAKQWASTWAEDSTWTLGAGNVHSGKDNIVKAWLGAMSGYPFAALVASVGAIEVHGDHAHVRVHVQESLSKADGGFLRVWGRYDDELTKKSGRWLFKSRTYNVLHMI